MGSLPFPLLQLNNITGEIMIQIGTEKNNETPYKLKENPGSNWPDSILNGDKTSSLLFSFSKTVQEIINWY